MAKILLLGSTGVGKTTFGVKLQYGGFLEQCEPTRYFTPKFKKGGIVLLDTAQNDLPPAIDLKADLYNYLDVVMVMYDCTSQDSFDKVDSYAKFVRASNKTVPIFLVGNKADLPATITTDMVEKLLAKEQFAGHQRFSCKDDSPSVIIDMLIAPYLAEEKARKEREIQGQERTYGRDLKSAIKFLEYLSKYEQESTEERKVLFYHYKQPRGFKEWEQLMREKVIAFVSVQPKHLVLAKYFFENLWERDLYMDSFGNNMCEGDSCYLSDPASYPNGGMEGLIEKMPEHYEDKENTWEEWDKKVHPFKLAPVKYDFTKLLMWAKHDLKEIKEKYPKDLYL